MNKENKQIGKLERVDLRQVWKHEAHDFTKWLSNNLEQIQEVTGIKLNLVESEAPVGNFSVDILAEDINGDLVVIENQLEKTDHDHLGKLLTYMSNHGAKTAIWITSDPRPEHEKAIHWLNEFLPADMSFYLIKIEAVKINESLPAPLFSIIAGPSLESKVIGLQKKELAERHLLRLNFWKGLLDKAKKHTLLHAKISPSKDNWISTGAGRSGLSWVYVILMDHARIELYIDTPDAEQNKKIFKNLLEYKKSIEDKFGSSLDWQLLENKRASRICTYIRKFGGLKNQENWDKLQEEMINTMMRFEKALKPFLNQIP